MDLRSYIELKEAYKSMYAPQAEVVSEEVEAVEEEILGEEDLQEKNVRGGGTLDQRNAVRAAERDAAGRERNIQKNISSGLGGV